jgi:hypothetical protein
VHKFVLADFVLGWSFKEAVKVLQRFEPCQAAGMAGSSFDV